MPRFGDLEARYYEQRARGVNDEPDPPGYEEYLEGRDFAETVRSKWTGPDVVMPFAEWAAMPETHAFIRDMRGADFLAGFLAESGLR